MLRILTLPIDSIIRKLPWVDRYGGLVRTFEQIHDISTNENPVFIVKKFPVSCDVTNLQCEQEGRYNDLVPNSNYKSVVYLEDRGGVNIAFPVTNSKERVYTYTSNIRLTAWLNGPALGYDSCLLGDMASLDILRVLNFRKDAIAYHKTTWPFFSINSLEVRVTGFERHDKDTVFDRYSYMDQEAFLAPFDFFAAKIQITARIMPGCFKAFTPKTSIDCL